MKQYDYLIVGAGLYGAVFAHEAKKAGKRCLVIDKRAHIAGNIYTEEVEGINVHRYGAHIFHTNNKAVWQYVNQFAEFNRYTNSPVANYHGEIYNLPFNMNTFNRMWGVVTPLRRRRRSSEQRAEAGIRPKGLEEQAISPGRHRTSAKKPSMATPAAVGPPAPGCPLSSSSACPSVLPTTTTTSRPVRASQRRLYTAMVEKDAGRCGSAPGVDYLAGRQSWTSWRQGRLHRPGGRLLRLQAGRIALQYRSVRFETEIWTPTTIRATPSSTTPTPRPLHPGIIEHKH